VTDRVECKLKAKELLRGRWENAVGACLLFFVSTFLLSFLLSPIPVFGWIIIALISTFLTGSFIKYCIKLNETEGKVKYLECLISFKTTLKILACDILIGLVVGIGWMIFTMIFSVAFIASQSIVVIIVVLIILVALGFFIEAILFPVPMILTEDEGVGVMEAIEMSFNITKGYRWKYIVMNLSFIGWMILSFLTFGIGMLWLQPYMMLTYYLFYKGIRSANTTI